MTRAGFVIDRLILARTRDEAAPSPQSADSRPQPWPGEEFRRKPRRDRAKCTQGNVVRKRRVSDDAGRVSERD